MNIPWVSDDNELKEKTARELRQLRKVKRGMTQQKIAQYLGVSRKTYANYESGEIHIPFWVAYKAAQYFAVPLEILLPDEKE